MEGSEELGSRLPFLSRREASGDFEGPRKEKSGPLLECEGLFGKETLGWGRIKAAFPRSAC